LLGVVRGQQYLIFRPLDISSLAEELPRLHQKVVKLDLVM
jgi:hypothetical protein